MSVPTEQDPTPAVTLDETAVVESIQPEPMAESIQPEPMAEPDSSTEPLTEPDPEPAVAEPPVAEAPTPQPVAIPVATLAPLVTVAAEPEPVAQPAPAAQPTAAAQQPAHAETSRLLGLPLQLINQLLARLGAAPLRNLADLLPALRLVSLLLLAGITLKLTGATLGAINELPLVGRLLELVGLISALQFIAANALRSQKRAELLARIQKLKRDCLG